MSIYVTKQRYFSNFEKCLSIFGHQLESAPNLNPVDHKI